ncbi:MAG: DUF1214 domain-containing protein [Thermodesulfobacteriota bacterium]|nr:DUF1214 domain-containing protein [Thermodesulfobacteriota bacterium]
MKRITDLSVVRAFIIITLITVLQAGQAQAARTEPTGGQPPIGTKVSVPSLDEQVAYQRAFEATLWAMPALGIYGLRTGFMSALKMNNNDIAAFSGPLKQKMEAITPNTVTPYILAFTNLSEGPVVLEIPARTEKSSLYGQVVDFWQITIADVGPAGVDKGKGGKYLFLPPGYDAEIPKGYIPVQSAGNRIGFAFRSVRGPGATNEDAYNYTKLLRMYPMSKAANPPKQRFVDGRDIVVPTLPHYTMAALEDIKVIIDIEPVFSRDKVMMGMLATLGIEKGKPFDPTPELKSAMERGVQDAYFYMQSLVDKMHDANLYWSDRHWSLVMQPDDKRGFAFETDEMVNVDARAAAWHFFTFYPAVMSDKVGTVYLAPIADSNARPVAAGKNYRLRIPADTPAKQFWSLTMYDHATWSFIINPLGRSGLSSLDKDDLQVNDDGSVDIYFGPDEPEGHRSNWLPTEGKRPYIWLRLYGPDTPFWEKSFTMPDVELLD